VGAGSCCACVISLLEIVDDELGLRGHLLGKRRLRYLGHATKDSADEGQYQWRLAEIGECWSGGPMIVRDRDDEVWMLCEG